MRISQLTIIGVGLLGGSVALAARQRRVVQRVVGYDRSAAVLGRTGGSDMLDLATTDFALAVRDAELLVFCTPVDHIVTGVRQAAALCRPEALLTDVGSTKTAIVRELEGLNATFVGSHPLAGSEKTGPEHARGDLFANRLVVVTPSAGSPAAAVSKLMTFWHALGASVVPMSPEEHDRALALTSHLPHLLASALAGVLPEEWRFLTATGFRDTTRVAAGSPQMWRAIFQANREPILEALAKLQTRLDLYRTALEGSDAEELLRLWLEGKQTRDSLSNR